MNEVTDPRELKATAYDILAQIQFLQGRLNDINNQIVLVSQGQSTETVVEPVTTEQSTPAN